MQTKKITAKQLKGHNNKIKVDGRDYELDINFNVLAELEDEYGSVETGLIELQKGTVKAIRLMMYAIMTQEQCNENLTIKEVGKKLNSEFMNEITSKLGKSMKDSFGESEETNKEVGE